MDSSEKERVREATDIVQLVGETVQLRQRGSEFWGCCPFHDEKTPSFHVSAQTGLWHCFGCGEGGDVFAFIEKREGMSFVEALRYLAERAGIELHFSKQEQKGPKRSEVLSALSAAEAFYASQLMRSRTPEAEQARTYLAKRNMGSSIAKKWGLGYAPGHSLLTQHLTKAGYTKDVLIAADLCIMRGSHLADRFYERVMFPIHNEHAQTIGFGGRVMGDAKPKYINSKDSAVWHKSKNLFGLDLAKASIQQKKTVIVCEGYTDTIALHEAGFDYAVAVLGTALTLEHIQLLSRFKPDRIVMLLDGDAAGQRAQEKAVRFIDKTAAALLSVTLPNNMDPQEYLNAHTKEELEALLDDAKPLIDEVLARKLFSVNLQNPGKKVAALQEVSSILAPLEGSVVLDGYATQVADYLGLQKAAVMQAIAQAEVFERENAGHAQFVRPESISEKGSPLTEIERGIAYILLNHPKLGSKHLSLLQDVSFTNETYKAVVWTILSQDTVKDSSEAMKLVRLSVEGADVLLAKPPQGYTQKENEQLFLRLLTNHILLEAENELRILRAHIASAQQSEDPKEIMQKIADTQKRIVRLQDDLDKLQVI